MVLANQRPLLFVFVSNPGVIAVFHLFEVNNYWTFEQVKFYCPQIYISLLKKCIPAHSLIMLIIGYSYCWCKWVDKTFKGDPGPKVDKSQCSRVPSPTFWDSDMTLQLLQFKKIWVSFIRYKMITESIIQLESKSSFYRSQIL